MSIETRFAQIRAGVVHANYRAWPLTYAYALLGHAELYVRESRRVHA